MLVAAIAYRASLKHRPTAEELERIRRLVDRVPRHRVPAAGPVGVEYDPRNPANSIVLCEDWSGLRLIAEAQKAAE